MGVAALEMEEGSPRRLILGKEIVSDEIYIMIRGSSCVRPRQVPSRYKDASGWMNGWMDGWMDG